MKNHLYASLIAVGFSFTCLLAPSSADAATLQKIYADSVKATFQKGQPLRVDAKADLGLTVVPQEGAKIQTDTQLRLMLRYRKQEGDRQDSEGRLAFEKLKTNDASSALAGITDNPFAIEWKNLDKTSYFRLKAPELAPEIEKQLGPDAAKFLGQWLSAEKSGSSQDVKSLTATSLPVAGNLLQDSTADDLAGLKVIKAEKRLRRANGDIVYRLRLAIDPATINKTQKDRLAELKGLADSESKRERIAAINKDAAEQRASAKHTWIAAEVNETTKTLERLEIQGWHDTTKKDFFTEKISKETLKFKAGITFRRDGDWEVIAPTNSLDLKEVMTGLLSQLFAQAAPDATVMPAASNEIPSWVIAALSQTYTDQANGFSVRYKDGWTIQQPDANSIWFFSDTEEGGIVPSMSVQIIEASSTLDIAGNIESLWQEIYGVLLQSTLEENGAKQAVGPEIGASSVLTDKGASIEGTRYLMTRMTAEGQLADYVLILPIKDASKYLVYMFEEPIVPSSGLLHIRDAMRQSLRILE